MISTLKIIFGQLKIFKFLYSLLLHVCKVPSKSEFSISRGFLVNEHARRQNHIHLRLLIYSSRNISVFIEVPSM